LFGLDHFAGDQRFYVGGVGELWVSEVDDLIEYFVDEYEVFAYGLFVDDSAEVFDDDYDSVEQFEDVGGRDVEAGGGHDVEGRLLEVGEIDALDIEDGFDVALGEFDLAVEEFGGVLDEVGTEVAVDDRVSSRREEKYLGYHIRDIDIINYR
jgi:hypothetical protein